MNRQLTECDLRLAETSEESRAERAARYPTST